MQHCGILKHLLPGDQVLADRGFNVQDSARFYCAKVKIPPFTCGKKQLSKIEVDRSRDFSQVRIHVEHVIDVLDKSILYFKECYQLGCLWHALQMKIVDTV